MPSVKRYDKTLSVLAITPDEFQAAALAWIAALSLVLTTMGVALAKLWPLIEQFKQVVHRQQDHSDRISALSQTVTNVALAVRPSTPAPNSDDSIKSKQ